MKIAVEEHFISPEGAQYLIEAESFMGPERIARMEALLKRLADCDKIRLDVMDAAGIDHAILSLCGPGAQIEKDTSVALRFARECNDGLAKTTSLHPSRFSGLGHLALQDPFEAANELERCISQLGMVGVMINGHTLGSYLDEDRYSVFWERAAAFGAPVYIHPAYAARSSALYSNFPELGGVLWGWMAETGGHTLRLIFGGVFDRFPKAKVVLGHMGEALPFLQWRLDRSYRKFDPVKRSAFPPSHYLKNNIWATTSGVHSPAALTCVINEMGVERVMFSIDYPFEDSAEASEWINNAPISAADRTRICSTNAQELFFKPRGRQVSPVK